MKSINFQKTATTVVKKGIPLFGTTTGLWLLVVYILKPLTQPQVLDYIVPLVVDVLKSLTQAQVWDYAAWILGVAWIILFVTLLPSFLIWVFCVD